jgi:hypothetical protein
MGLWDRDWYVDAQMKRMGLGGKPKPSRFSAKGAPPDDDAAQRFMRAAAARAGARAEQDAERFPTAPPGRFARTPPRIDRPVAWAALFMGILCAGMVAVFLLAFVLKRWF